MSTTSKHTVYVNIIYLNIGNIIVNVSIDNTTVRVRSFWIIHWPHILFWPTCCCEETLVFMWFSLSQLMPCCLQHVQGGPPLHFAPSQLFVASAPSERPYERTVNPKNFGVQDDSHMSGEYRVILTVCFFQLKQMSNTLQ